MRRYQMKDPEFKVYTHYYGLYKSQSQILTKPELDSPNASTITLDDKDFVKSLLLELKGIEKGKQAGKYFKPDANLHVQAVLPNTIEKLEILEKDWERLKEKLINEGKEIPEIMPQHMRKELQRLQAKHDILEEEIEKLEKIIQEFESRENEIQISKALKSGMKEAGRLEDGFLVEIDGQPVREINGVMVIDAGRYNGLSVAEYRKLAKQWKFERRQNLGYNDEVRIKAKREGREVQSGELRRAFPRFPDWPGDAVNHKKKKKTSGR